jgi:hypothetical protein
MIWRATGDSRCQPPGPSIASVNSAMAASMSPAVISAAILAVRDCMAAPGAGAAPREASSSPPGSASTRRRTSAGSCCATRNAMWPPREWPIKSTGARPSTRMKPIVSATCCAMVKLPLPSHRPGKKWRMLGA